MQIDEASFRGIYHELLDENSLAARAVLKVLDLDFTTSVPTLAVTLGDRPTLKVNLEFMSEHCHTEAHVKACLLHEFLHILLGHTMRFERMDDATNLALDAVINSIIHRSMGEEYSSFFSNYYRDQRGVPRMLRDRSPREKREDEGYRRGIDGRPVWRQVWKDLYSGKLVSDDILALARDMPQSSLKLLNGKLLIGSDLEELDYDRISGALGETMKQMNGEGIWRNPFEKGIGNSAFSALLQVESKEMRGWRRRTREALIRYVVPDRRSKIKEPQPLDYRIPVLSPRDRRAFMASMWSPIIPDSNWLTEELRQKGICNVYLDVSGSMYAEMPYIIGLLGSLSRYIRNPFWAFSTLVAPARIVKGQLEAATTGGTSMSCVLEHVIETRPQAALVVTDGYIEMVPRELLRRASDTAIGAILTRDGSPAELERAGIPYTQLERLPND